MYTDSFAKEGRRRGGRKIEKKQNTDKKGENSEAAPQEEPSVCSKWRMDVIGQPSHRGSTACFHRALNYASLSFHQPHTGRQIKNASAEVLPSQLSQRWEDKSRARRFVTRSTTQLKSDAQRCQSNEIILIHATADC